MHVVEDVARIFAAAQEDRPLDRIDRLTARDRTASRRVSLDDRGDVAHQDGGPILCRDHGSLDVRRPAPFDPVTALITSFSVSWLARSRTGSASTWYSFW